VVDGYTFERWLVIPVAEQTEDAELTTLLTAVLTEATAKKEAQDEARAEAQRLCDEGDRLLAGFDGRIRWKDSIEKSIVEYKKGLELADQVNGEHGWESVMQPLADKLKHAEDEKVKEDEARKYVADLLEDTGKLTPMTATAYCKEVDTLKKLVAKIEHAMKMETNDKDLTAQLRSALLSAQAIKESEDTARRTATAQLAKGERLMGQSEKDYNTIDDAIAAYENALEQDTHDDLQKSNIERVSTQAILQLLVTLGTF